jgi:hypothetical protein
MRQSSAGSFDEQLSVSLARQQFRDAQPQLFLRFISDSFPTVGWRAHIELWILTP